MSMPKSPRSVGVITMALDHNWWLVLRPNGTKKSPLREFGVGAEVLRPGEIGVLHQHLVAGQRLVAAILGQRRPAGESGHTEPW